MVGSGALVGDFPEGGDGGKGGRGVEGLLAGDLPTGFGSNTLLFLSARNKQNKVMFSLTTWGRLFRWFTVNGL